MSTKSQKRVGRKRMSMVVRQPNGRAVPRRERGEAEGYSPSLVKRMADLAAHKLADAFYGTALGIAFLSGQISRDQCAAGRRWAQARSDWLRAIDAQRLDMKALALGDGQRRASPDADSYEGHKLMERDLAACRRYHRLEAVLTGCGLSADRNARALAEAPGLLSLDHGEMRAAILGLEALHRYLHGQTMVAS